MPIKINTKRLHLKNTWTISRNSSSFKDNVFITFEQDGITAYGEAAPNIRYDQSPEKTIEALEKLNLEKYNLLNFWDLKQVFDKSIKQQTCARAAVDMVILDWVGKKYSIPVYRLFGLNNRKTPITSYSIGIDTPDKMQQKIELSKDMPVYKIKLGVKNDRQIISAIREVTDKPLYIDANEGWKNKENALKLIYWLADQNVVLVEQPLPAHMLNESIWLKEKSPLPIFADESVKNNMDIFSIANSFDGINIKLMKSGGILEAKKMIHTAKALNLKIMIGCMIESSLAVSAAAQLCPLADYADLDGNLLIENDPFSGVKIRNGKLQLNDLPGLGVFER
jgi:L-alanine-DL-glutamate epimerase-like enolase superfamily enzyme